MVHEIKLAVKDLEQLMCGTNLGFEHVSIIAPAGVHDSCHVSWSLHQKIVDRQVQAAASVVDALRLTLGRLVNDRHYIDVAYLTGRASGMLQALEAMDALPDDANELRAELARLGI